MHTLFNLVPRALQGIQIPGLWPYVREGLRRNIGQVIRYYRNAPMAVKSDHILVKLIQSVNIPLSHNLERYFANVDAVSLNLSMALKMTSSLYRGKMWDGDFYGPGHDEVLLAHTETFDVDRTHDDWQNVTPVRVLRHPRSDLYMNLPNGHLTGTETGICVIAINVPMLMVQYRAFRLAQDGITGGVDEKSTMMFIHMYVLPNMLFSHLDQALFNRIRKLQAKEAVGESIRKHPFAQIDYSAKVDACYNQILTNFDRHPMNFVGTLQSVPAAARSNMEQAMKVPDMAPTRQAMWALALARLPMLDFVLTMAMGSPQTRNQLEVDLINRTFLGWQQERLFDGVMDPLVRQDVIEELTDILSKANPGAMSAVA
ncbi:hypothetical protein [Paraburkholderia sp. BCC1886]|uniref:hypothetical protein n=1 Tax=Paraburkholderia sp. BCC1886 TaxID=2562670 RepID=UPI001182F6D5|nr:hypothetical protein [Paraburkholderia sp. BCC1886]